MTASGLLWGGFSQLPIFFCFFFNPLLLIPPFDQQLLFRDASSECSPNFFAPFTSQVLTTVRWGTKKHFSTKLRRRPCLESPTLAVLSLSYHDFPCVSGGLATDYYCTTTTTTTSHKKVMLTSNSRLSPRLLPQKRSANVLV